jgi:hypothetical protein
MRDSRLLPDAQTINQTAATCGERRVWPCRKRSELLQRPLATMEQGRIKRRAAREASIAWPVPD